MKFKDMIYINSYNTYSICKIEVNLKRIISHREIEDGNEIVKGFKIELKKLWHKLIIIS